MMTHQKAISKMNKAYARVSKSVLKQETISVSDCTQLITITSTIAEKLNIEKLKDIVVPLKTLIELCPEIIPIRFMSVIKQVYDRITLEIMIHVGMILPRETKIQTRYETKNDSILNVYMFLGEGSFKSECHYNHIEIASNAYGCTSYLIEGVAHPVPENSIIVVESGIIE